MKNQIFKRGSALFLSMAIALSLGACGERGGSRRDRDTEQETKPSHEEVSRETLPAQSSTRSDGTFATDSVVLSHTEHNGTLHIKETVPPDVNTFHLYVDNLSSMEGYVHHMSQFQTCMQGLLSAGYDMYAEMYAHYMTRENGAGDLFWTEEEIQHGSFRKVYSREFFRGNTLPDYGTIATLFDKKETPFKENELTVVVSTFLEQSFNISVLTEGIERYLDSYPASAAAVVGLCSDFDGTHYVPMETGSRTTFFVDNFTGQIPFYAVIVGPEADVQEYMDNCTSFLDSESIAYEKSIYTNTVFNQIKAEPLTLELIPDHKAKKATPPIFSSYNCGVLSDNDKGNAFFSTFSSITTRAAKGRNSEEDNQVDVGRTTQMSLLSRNYDGKSQFDWNVKLYRFDEPNSMWVDAGQSANDMVKFSCIPVNGKIVDEISEETVLADGRRELYVTAVLNFAEDSAISRENVYRLEISTNLNRQNTDAAPASAGSKLKSMSVETADYYGMISDLCTLGGGNYVWTGTSPITTNPTRLAEARDILAHTPNLDILIDGLSRIENKYHPNEERIQYFDFLFNLPDENSRR